LEQGEIRSTRTVDFVVEMQKLHSHIKEQLQSSNQKYKHRVDQHRREIQFEVGDQVLAHIRKDSSWYQVYMMTDTPDGW